MKAYGDVDIGPRILDIGTSWSWMVSFTPRPLYLRKKASVTHWIGGRMGPITGLDDVEGRKYCPCWDLNSWHLAVEPVASRSTDFPIPAITELEVWATLATPDSSQSSIERHYKVLLTSEASWHLCWLQTVVQICQCCSVSCVVPAARSRSFWPESCVYGRWPWWVMPLACPLNSIYRLTLFH
jgi:hypothetical protein